MAEPIKTSNAGRDCSSPSFSPLYRQIKNLIIASLRAGEWRPGEMIPSEMELAERFNVSQGTVRKAIDDLSAENLLVRRQGKGTFVATHLEEQTRYRFLRLVPKEGVAHRLQRKLISCERMTAPTWIMSALMRPADEPMLKICRVLSSAHAPVVLDEIWVPYKLFKSLSLELLSQYDGPMYGLFESEYGVHMVRATESITVMIAGEREAQLLQVEPGHALMQVQRLSYSYGDAPVEFRCGIYRTDDYYYRNELN